jgi:hypothetical protein
MLSKRGANRFSPAADHSASHWTSLCAPQVEDIEMTILGIEPAYITNPFAAPSRLDSFRPPRRDIARWSETAFFEAWNIDEGVGIFTHVGRCQKDLDLWWTQTFVYLPDGALIVDRSWGRSPDERSVSAGNLQIRVEEPLRRWSCQFDGAGELTTTKKCSLGLIGANVAVPVRWSVEGVAAGPIWDLHKCANPHGDWAGDSHTQQTYVTHGELVVAGKYYSMDGVGYNDHSRGPRTFNNFGGHNWAIAVMPGWTAHAINIWDSAKTLQMAVGTIFDEGGMGSIQSHMPPLDDLVGGPRRFPLVLTKADGTSVNLTADILHSFNISINEANDNLNGIDLVNPGDPLLLVEYSARLTTDSGEVGFGHLERSLRRSEWLENYG